MINEKYSIEEILNAVNDLQNLNKDRKNLENQIEKKDRPIDIPKNTLKIIEEAEKKNLK